MPRNSDYGVNEREDGQAAKSLILKDWPSHSPTPIRTYDVRTFAQGAGDMRIGALVMRGFPALDSAVPGELTLSLDTAKGDEYFV